MLSALLMEGNGSRKASSIEKSEKTSVKGSKKKEGSTVVGRRKGTVGVPRRFPGGTRGKRSPLVNQGTPD